jgi:replicative DNA helicase
LLLAPVSIAEVAAALESADFVDPINRIIYSAMLRLHSAGKPIDITLVVGEAPELPAVISQSEWEQVRGAFGHGELARDRRQLVQRDSVCQLAE